MTAARRRNRSVRDPNAEVPRQGSARLHDRLQMVESQIVARGVQDPAVLESMRAVPRESFVAPEAVAFAYDDSPLPIAEGQTISQPFVVALMAEAAEIGADDRVLEVGAGSGYGAAVLSGVAAEVFTVERNRRLAESASRRLRQLGYDNVEVRHGDGSLGWPEKAPFDAIVVTAAAPVGMPESLLSQLAPGGRLIIPTGPTLEGQELVRIRLSGDARRLERESLGAVRFVPLIGSEGWVSRSCVRRPESGRPMPRAWPAWFRGTREHD